MAEAHPDFAPVDGLVIERSKLKTLGWAVLALLAFPWGCLLVSAKVQDWIEGAGSRGRRVEVTEWGFLLGIGLIIGSPIMVWTLLRSAWVLRRRLVIGYDRLQIVERQNGNDVVVVQIPYSNVVSVNYQVTDTDRQVSIRLNDPYHRDSYDGESGGADNRDTREFHSYCICEAFRESASTIAAKINASIDEWKRTRLN